jgi:peptidoglycan/LPS O-acetylase OafA/YrhL
MACVALQHVLSGPGSEPGAVLGGLTLGQLGVAGFCALSGYFSLRSGDQKTARWLLQRLDRLFVPYWISLASIFAVNWAIGYKPVSTGLVVSEFLGTGYFTHPGRLVGVHVWFISLILVCYGLAAALSVKTKPSEFPWRGRPT